MRTLSTTLLLFFFSVSTFATDTYKYDMFLLGSKIGTIIVTHEKRSDGSDFFVMTSDARAKILWTDRTSKTRCEVVFKDGKMISSVHDKVENTSGQRICKVTSDKNGYKGTVNGVPFTVGETPTYCVSSLYVQEPKNVKRIFYEPDGTFADIKKIAPDAYEFKSSDGNRNVYRYKDGQITEMEFHLTFVSVTVKRAK